MQALLQKQSVPYGSASAGSRCSPLTPPAVRPGRACLQLQPDAVQQAVTYSSRSAFNHRCCAAAPSAQGVPSVSSEQEIQGMTQFLDSLKYNADGLVAVIVQHVDTGEVLMQAFADRAALSETMQSKLATFYSRSRKGRWCKGETSGHFIHVQGVYVDCDNDSIIYLSDPIGPSCHTGARTCWFSQAELGEASGSTQVHQHGASTSAAHMPRTTLLGLEYTIQQRRKDMEAKTEGTPSWTSKLLSNPELLCKKVREEAGELCQTLEQNEGKERAASEAADLLYHAMVLLNLQGVAMEDVLRVLRKRFHQSGIEEKAARPPKQ